MRAARRGPGDLIERLIAHGADVNARDQTDTSIDSAEDYTALHAAAFHGNTDAARVLLAHGANPNIRDRKYVSPPAGWAAYAGREEVCRLILGARIDPFQAIDFDMADRIPEVVQQSPWQLNRRFRELAPWEPPSEEWTPAPWHTPLAWGVVKNKPDAVRVLLEQGAAQVTAPDGRSLLDMAREAGHDEVADLLYRHSRVDATHGNARREEGAGE